MLEIIVALVHRSVHVPLRVFPFVSSEMHDRVNSGSVLLSRLLSLTLAVVQCGPESLDSNVRVL